MFVHYSVTYVTLFLISAAPATAAVADAQADAASLQPPLFTLSELLPPGPARNGDLFDHRSFGDALARYGIVAVAMQEGFAQVRREVMTAAARCFDASRSRGVATVGLPGGTTRRTLAGESNTKGDGELRPIFELPDHSSVPSAGKATPSAPEECLRFERRSTEFRKAVGVVARAFGARLAEVIEASHDPQFPIPPPEFGPGGGSTWSHGSGGSTFAELTLRGPRLEHFHAYERDPVFAAGAGPEAEMQLLRTQTLDFHADQGLFVVFSPGMMVPVAGGAVPEKDAGHFQVRSADKEGNVVALNLDVSTNGDGVLVVLLGDAVRQLGVPRAERLFHVPSHAFRMPGSSHAGDNAPPQQRLWYGLMQLPPPGLLAQNVIDPSTQQKLTFGDIRERVAALAGHEGESAIGCSPLAQWSEDSVHARRLAPRLLEDSATCDSESIYCWHRCMEIASAGVSPEECEAQGDGYRITCTDQFDQEYRPEDGHGDYYLACSNTTEDVAVTVSTDGARGGLPHALVAACALLLALR